jgi:penicillin-binding protein 1C
MSALKPPRGGRFRRAARESLERAGRAAASRAADLGRAAAAASAEAGAKAAQAARAAASFLRRRVATVERGPVAAAALALACLVLWGPPAARFPDDLSAAVYDRRGELLGAAVSSDGQWRLGSSGNPPDKYVRAVVAFEDKRFFSHMGIDAAALARAALQNARAGEVRSGGSTISMQVARLARPGRARTLWEKAAEAALALRLELLRGKRGVLRLYADNAPFGGNVVGLEAASFRFFGRPPSSLSWAEAATLAVLPNTPSGIHPGKNRDALLAKRDRLLRRLRDRGELSEDDLALALEEPLPPEPYPLPSLAPHLVARFLLAGAGRPGGPPARVETTLDASLQERATEILARRSERLASGGVYNGACVVARVGTGEVLAYVGNVPRPEAGGDAAAASARGYDVDLVRASRSSGSLFKPFLYAAALDSGELGPRSLLPDLPTRYGSYEPENNLGTYSGAVRADAALARSLNVPFVRLLRSFGVERFRDVLASTGMTTLSRRAEDYGLTLILGGAETSLWEMAGRFAALARTASEPPSREGGQAFDLGTTRSELEARPRRANPFSSGAAALTLDVLTRVARPEEEAAWEDYASARRIAWKTGTSFGYRDAWAIGVDGAYVVGVWVGNASGEGRPSLKGSLAAAPVLFDVFNLLAAGGAAGTGDSGGRPSEIAEAAGSAAALRETETCADSGWAAGPDCARVELVLVPADAKPLPLCPYCASVALSADGKYRVRAEEEPAGSVRVEKRFALPPGMEWYYRRNLDYRPLPPWRPGSAQSGSDRSLAILAPEEGASIYVPIELTGKSGATVFAAAHRDPGATVFWHLDGEYLGSTVGSHRMESRPAPGAHVLTLVDDAGRSASRRFTILSKE